MAAFLSHVNPKYNLLSYCRLNIMFLRFFLLFPTYCFMRDFRRANSE